ncbi:MAG: endonuclease/exonuclease/phosphatase family protein [Caldilineaceae bacterium]|nr:endonuclease/exonuclease/phosphatase family protein [Caldilineaceae bacterium]
MDITVGTFNLNNLFSRYNFSAEVELVRQGGIEVDAKVSFTFVEPVGYQLRTFMGRLVKPKTPDERALIADRIRAIDVDVLAVQEVEDIGVLRQFAEVELSGMYPYQVLVEGNDQRLIDVGLLSRYPIGAVTSWRFAVHPESPMAPVFSRDLLEVEVLDQRRRNRLFTIFNTHLKSNYIRWDEDPAVARPRLLRRRRRQAEMMVAIVEQRTRPDSSFVVLGDMNDNPDGEPLAPFRKAGWTDAMGAPQETRAPKREQPPSVTPTHATWTHRYKKRNKPAEYQLYDQIWLSAALSNKQVEAWIDRRSRHSGDGSDHDPAWIKLRL